MRTGRVGAVLLFADDQVDLSAADSVPHPLETEIRARDRLEAEHVLVECAALLDVGDPERGMGQINGLVHLDLPGGAGFTREPSHGAACDAQFLQWLLIMTSNEFPRPPPPPAKSPSRCRRGPGRPRP